MFRTREIRCPNQLQPTGTGGVVLWAPGQGAPELFSPRPGEFGARRVPGHRALRMPAPLPAGAVLVSGVYDLEPILHTYVNDELNMTR